MSTVSGKEYLHFLAQSPLEERLREQGVTARALTRCIQEKGSMLGRMMI
jgi:hypothetical protein